MDLYGAACDLIVTEFKELYEFHNAIQNENECDSPFIKYVNNLLLYCL